jgi:hypothetical protein
MRQNEVVAKRDQAIVAKRDYEENEKTTRPATKEE